MKQPKIRCFGYIATIIAMILTSRIQSAETETASIEQQVNQLLGKSAGASPEIPSKDPASTAKKTFKVRGIARTGSDTEPPTERRAVRFESRGIPKNVKVAGTSGNIEVKEVVRPALAIPSTLSDPKTFELSYTVDPASRLTKRSILFVKDSTKFADATVNAQLAELALILNDPRLRNFAFAIEGHSSAEGAASHNQRLSQERANAIVDQLALLGVSRNRLLPAGFGESQARFQENDPESLRAQDRKVEIFRLE